MNNMLASIHLNSDKPKHLEKLFNSFEAKAEDPTNFEMIVNIDNEDAITKKYLDSQILKRKFNLRYIREHEGDYFSGHLNANKILKDTHESVYFIANISDRAIVLTDNWDSILKQYEHKFADNLFRVNCSSFKNRSYSDFWECAFAPSNVFFVTKKFLDLTKNWTPCFSHDAFQQCVMYYLEKHDPFNSVQINRDIADNCLNFSGQKPKEKNDDENYQRIHGQLKMWNILISPKTQKEAKRRAMIIKANIIYYDKYNLVYSDEYSPYKIYDDNKNNICIRDNSNKKIIKYNYSVNSLKIIIVNFYRKLSYLNYCGGGFYENKQNNIFSLFWYLDFRYKRLRGIKDLYNKYSTIIFGDK